jgi:hypothetical protein
MMLGTEFERIHYRQMEERGWWLPENVEFDAFWEELVARGGWTDLFFDDTDPARLAQTPSDRIELLPAALQGARPYFLTGARISGDPGLPPAADTVSPLDAIVGGRAMERWLAEAPTVFADRHWVPWVDVHPVTAAEHGLAHNMSVWVTSPRGRYRARVKLSKAPPQAPCARRTGSVIPGASSPTRFNCWTARPIR